MGWLFAVGLGLQHKSRKKVIWALAPIGIGHALSIAAVVAAVLLLRDWFDLRLLRWAAAALLIAFGAYRLFGRHRPRRTSMQAGFGELLIWSFLLAAGHGAGLMLLPVLLQMPDFTSHYQHVHVAEPQVVVGLLATIVHSVSTLVTTGVVAIVVYEWIGLAFLRRGWINLDWIWAIALLAAGGFLILG
jgi:hypothetical protein